MKRYLSVLLSVLMLLTMLPLGAIGASAAGVFYRILQYLSIQQYAVWYPKSGVIVCISGYGICGRIGT